MDHHQLERDADQREDPSRMGNQGVECVFRAFVVHGEDFKGLSVSMQEALDLRTPLANA